MPLNSMPSLTILALLAVLEKESVQGVTIGRTAELVTPLFLFVILLQSVNEFPCRMRQI